MVHNIIRQCMLSIDYVGEEKNPKVITYLSYRKVCTEYTEKKVKKKIIGSCNEHTKLYL